MSDFKGVGKFNGSIGAGRSVNPITDDVIKAHDEMQARCDQNAIFWSKLTSLSVYYHIQVYCSCAKDKRRHWSPTKAVTSLD